MKKTAVIYWSGTGNTEAMANAVLEGMTAAGADAKLLTVDQVNTALQELLQDGTVEKLFQEYDTVYVSPLS